MNETLNETAGAAVIDTQAADVGTTGQQIPEAELGMSIEDSAITVIGVDMASGPDRSVEIIRPTVGRKVWFFPNGCQFHSEPKCIHPEDPMDADVVYVWSDFMVNLSVKDHIGQVHAFTSVRLVQPGESVPGPGNAYATWMPYQVSTARAA